MCKHSSTTVVAMEGTPIHQCDFCGATLPELEVADDVFAAGFDAAAWDFWLRNATIAACRWFDRLQALKFSDPAAYKAEVRRVLARGE